MLVNSVVNNPVVVGSSVHNVRIERLWRDTFRCVLSVYYQLFMHLEGCGKLDPLSESDLFVLHYVYIPRISNALNMFRWGWNNHAVTTEHCKTPLQLFTTGALARGPQRQQSSLNSQGSIENSSGVPVPRIVSPLSPTKETELRSLINPLKHSTNYGIDVYNEVRQFVENS